MSSAAEHKARGTDAFKAKDYPQAIKSYGDAIATAQAAGDKTDVHVFYSNRSAAHLGAADKNSALKVRDY